MNDRFQVGPRAVGTAGMGRDPSVRSTTVLGGKQLGCFQSQDVLKRTKDESPSPDGRSNSSQGRISLKPDADFIRGDATGAKVLCLGRQRDSRLQSPGHATSRAGPAWPERSQPIRPVHGIAGLALDRAGPEGSRGSRPAFGRVQLALFRCLHLDARAVPTGTESGVAVRGAV